MTVLAIFKAYLDLSVKDSHYHSVVKFDLTIGTEDTSKKSQGKKDTAKKHRKFFGQVKENTKKDTTEKHRKFLENKKNYTKFKVNISNALRKENRNKGSKPETSSFFKKLTSKFYDSNLEAKTPNRDADFCLHDKEGHVYHHVKIQKTLEHANLNNDEKLQNISLYIIVTDNEKLTEKNKEIFERINRTEEDFSDFKTDMRKRIENALQNVLTTHNSDEEKQQRFKSSFVTTDSSCLFLCCHVDVDESPKYSRVDETRKYKRLN